jgi:hypothetical protein
MRRDRRRGKKKKTKHQGRQDTEISLGSELGPIANTHLMCTAEEATRMSREGGKKITVPGSTNARI